MERIKANENHWEKEYIRKNKQALMKVIRIFHPNSKKGIFLILSFLNIEVLINFKYTFIGPVNTFLYLAAIYLLVMLFQILPNKIIDNLFPPLTENYLNEVNQSLLISLVKGLHKVHMFVFDIYKMIFIHFNILIISGIISLVFGLAIISRTIPLYLLIHFVLTILVLKMVGVCFKLNKSKGDLKERDE